MEGGGYTGHPVLPEETLAQVRGHCHAGGGPMGGCCNYLAAYLPTGIPLQIPEERRPTWWGPPRGQRGSPVGIRGHPHAGTEYWKTEPGSSAHYQCPCSHSSSHLQSSSLDRHERSLDRHERSPSQHRLDMWPFETLRKSWFQAKDPIENPEGILFEHNWREVMRPPKHLKDANCTSLEDAHNLPIHWK